MIIARGKCKGRDLAEVTKLINREGELMEYEIRYKITSSFLTQVEAVSESDAKAQFRELDMRTEVEDNILKGGLEHDEIAIENVEPQEIPDEEAK